VRNVVEACGIVALLSRVKWRRWRIDELSLDGGFHSAPDSGKFINYSSTQKKFHPEFFRENSRRD
jgi:hypothetical protein